MMPYTSRQSGKKLTVEERIAKAALAAYRTEGATVRDWVPTAILYRRYRTWHAERHWRHDPDAPALLTARQFGRAVRRVFPGILRRKRSSGRRQYGYAYLVGPFSMVTPPPRKRVKQIA